MRIDHGTQLRHVFLVTSGSTPSSGNRQYWDGEIPWVTPEDLSERVSYWLEDTRRKITQAGYESSGATIVPAYSIVLSKRAPIGQLAVLKRSACSNQGCFLLTPRSDVDTRFFYYWLSCEVGHLKALGRGSTFMELSGDDLKSIHIPNPAPSRQRAIADYLDHETAWLDALVAEKGRLLRLLTDKRRALITRAVTRGLDLNVPLRDSGIPWLGEIPAHWETWKVEHLAEVGNGSTPSRSNAAYWSEGKIPWLNSSVVNRPEVTHSEQFVTALAAEECHLPRVRSGSVLVAITGQGKTRGRAAVLLFDATINQHLAFIHPKRSHLLAWFLKWTLFAAYDFLRSISDDAGGTKGALTCEEVANLRVPVPPIREQVVILEMIGASVDRLDSLQAVAKNTISLLRERRAALISSAVAGQIDMEKKYGSHLTQTRKFPRN